MKKSLLTLLKRMLLIVGIPVGIVLAIILAVILTVALSFLGSIADVFQEIITNFLWDFLSPILKFFGIQPSSKAHGPSETLINPLYSMRSFLMFLSLALGGFSILSFWKKRKKEEQQTYDKEITLAFTAITLFILTFLPDSAMLSLMAFFIFAIGIFLLYKIFNKDKPNQKQSLQNEK